MDSKTNDRRGFLHGMLAAGSLAAAVPVAAEAQPASSAAGDLPFLPAYTRAQNYKSLKQSSYDRTGGNSDRWPIAAGGVQEVFNAACAGVIMHIWFTVTNEGSQEIGSFYSNIDYMVVPRLPDDSLYFHAQYRQSAPCIPVASSGPKLNPDGKQNYVYCETRGRGHLMGVTLGVLE